MLLGVLLGAGATVLVDRRRWRREAVMRLLERRTELYAEYLVATEDTGRDLPRVLQTTAAEATPALLALKDEVCPLRDQFQEAVRRDIRSLLAGRAPWSA
ncbi:hypothetical protein [Streptomyces misionensis]|uniref:hypothetical protein n=1 Tax=Streptomyces misionensis TaxID=67331 RepID=UPI0036901D12